MNLAGGKRLGADERRQECEGFNVILDKTPFVYCFGVMPHPSGSRLRVLRVPMPVGVVRRGRGVCVASALGRTRRAGGAGKGHA